MKLILASKRLVAGNVWQFKFTPEHPVVWRAGQFIRVGLRHASPDAGGFTRWFTISGAPYEEVITITTRLTPSSFKRALAALPVGGQLDMIEEPAGDFLWRAADQPHIFAAQGIGITPFYAIMKDRIHAGLPIWATLFYAHQPGNAVIFADEIAAWAKQDSTLHLETVTGTLTAAQVAELAPDYASRWLYVSGPKSFVSLCMPPYHLPLSRLKQDNFPGYAAVNY